MGIGSAQIILRCNCIFLSHEVIAVTGNTVIQRLSDKALTQIPDNEEKALTLFPAKDENESTLKSESDESTLHGKHLV